MSSSNEVLVVRSDLPVSMNSLPGLVDFEFLVRSDAESNPFFRQVIPYIVVSLEGRVLVYARSSSTTEQRLMGHLSIGWGGHVEHVDGPEDGEPRRLDTYIRKCAEREIREELSLGPPLQRHRLGLIDEDSDVGRFHLGWLELWEYANVSPTIALDTASATYLLRLNEVRSLEPRLERWSQIALAMLPFGMP